MSQLPSLNTCQHRKGKGSKRKAHEDRTEDGGSVHTRAHSGTGSMPRNTAPSPDHAAFLVFHDVCCSDAAAASATAAAAAAAVSFCPSPSPRPTGLGLACPHSCAPHGVECPCCRIPLRGGTICTPSMRATTTEQTYSARCTSQITQHTCEQQIACITASTHISPLLLCVLFAAACPPCCPI